MYTPKPPCFLVGCCNDNFEESKFCKKVGPIGHSFFDKHRARLLMTATFITFICIILSIVSVFATSSNSIDVKNTAWTVGYVDGGGKLYVGLNEIYVEFANGTTVDMEWNDASCSAFEDASSDAGFCNDCKTACGDSVNVAIVSLATTIPTITTDIQRSTRRGDMNCQKFMGIFTGFLGLFTTLASLSAYADGCYNNLPVELIGHNISYSLGPGFICLLVATLLKVFDIIVMIFTPVVPYIEEEEQDANIMVKPLSEERAGGLGSL